MEGHERLILLDTNALIWATSDPERLSKKALRAIHRASQGTGIAISAISLWEVALIASKGRLRVTGTVQSIVTEVSAKVSIRPVTVSIAVLATQFPADYPADPCDRIIGATALSEGMTLISKDSKIRECLQIETIW